MEIIEIDWKDVLNSYLKTPYSFLGYSYYKEEYRHDETCWQTDIQIIQIYRDIISSITFIDEDGIRCYVVSGEASLEGVKTMYLNKMRELNPEMYGVYSKYLHDKDEEKKKYHGFPINRNRREWDDNIVYKSLQRFSTMKPNIIGSIPCKLNENNYIKTDERETSKHNENVLSNIHEQAINVLKSYGGNWVMNAFSPQRQEEVLNYLYHRYKTISTSDLKKAFDSILDELSNINLKPFGE